MSHARTDIRVNVDCPDSWKVARLCDRLGDGAFRCLIRLWCRVALCRPKGELDGMEDRDVEALAGWTGERGAFLTAAVETGLIDRIGHRSGDRIGYRIHGWEEHQPFVANRSGRQKASRIANAAKRERNSMRRKDFSESVTEPDTASDTGTVTDSVSPSSSPYGRKRSADAAAGVLDAPPRAAPEPARSDVVAPMLTPPAPIRGARVSPRPA